MMKIVAKTCWIFHQTLFPVYAYSKSNLANVLFYLHDFSPLDFHQYFTSISRSHLHPPNCCFHFQMSKHHSGLDIVFSQNTTCRTRARYVSYLSTFEPTKKKKTNKMRKSSKSNKFWWKKFTARRNQYCVQYHPPLSPPAPLNLISRLGNRRHLY